MASDVRVPPRRHLFHFRVEVTEVEVACNGNRTW